MDLETLRKSPKLVEDYTPEEVEVFMSHKDELTEDEKWAFQDYLKEDTLEDDTEETLVAEEGAVSPPENTEEIPPVITPEPESFTLKSKEELDNFIAKAIEEREAAKPKTEQMTASEQKAEVAKTLEIFPEGYVPKDANEFASILMEKVVPQVRESIKQETEQEKESLRKANETFDFQFNQLASWNLVPPLSTPEGQKINQEIALVSAKHGINNYFDGYEKWRQIPKEQGGGLETAPAPKKDMSAQKKAAAMVGGGDATAESNKPKATRSYNEIHSKSLDSLLEDIS